MTKKQKMMIAVAVALIVLGAVCYFVMKKKDGASASVTVKPAASTSTTSKKSVTPEIVQAVIRGDYGNGSERQTAIEALGYNYAEVQAAVNAQLA